MVKIGDKIVDRDQSIFVIAEIGINHNGDLNIAKQLIDVAVMTGCDAVKFQKRTVDVVYTPEELARHRRNPFGSTNGDLKRGLEFGKEQYDEIDLYCREKRILWFASPWDEASIDFLEQYNPPCYKVASASLTDDELLRHIRAKNRPVILSTGMSTMDQIRHAVEILREEGLVLLHCVSTYPSKTEDINLAVITSLSKEFPSIPVGYSGHELGIAISLAAVAMGACVVERHITLERAMWGSDQAASLAPRGLQLLVRDIRRFKIAKGDGVKVICPDELKVMKKLRRI